MNMWGLCAILFFGSVMTAEVMGKWWPTTVTGDRVRLTVAVIMLITWVSSIILATLLVLGIVE